MIDLLVHSAHKNDMFVNGYRITPSCYSPDHVINISDPAILRSVMETHLTVVMSRYQDKLDRWDVVLRAMVTQGKTLNEDISLHHNLWPD